MAYLALVIFVLACVCIMFGFSGLASFGFSIAKLLLFVAVVLFVLHFFGLIRPKDDT